MSNDKEKELITNASELKNAIEKKLPYLPLDSDFNREQVLLGAILAGERSRQVNKVIDFMEQNKGCAAYAVITMDELQVFAKYKKENMVLEEQLNFWKEKYRLEFDCVENEKHENRGVSPRCTACEVYNERNQYKSINNHWRRKLEQISKYEYKGKYDRFNTSFENYGAHIERIKNIARQTLEDGGC